MLALLEKPAQDTTRVNTLNEIGWVLKKKDPDQARKYLNESIQLATQLDFKKGLGDAWNYLGVLETIFGKVDEAIEANNKALEIRTELNDIKGLASIYNNLGNIYKKQQDYPNSIINYKKSMKMRRELKDTLRMARLDFNLSIVYERINSFNEAQESALKYLLYGEQKGDDYIIGQANNSLGNVMYSIGNDKKALEHYRLAATKFKSIKKEWNQATALNNMVTVYGKWADEKTDSLLYDEAKLLFDSAISYSKQVIEIRKEKKDSIGLARIFNNLGSTYKDLGSYFEQKGESQQAAQRWTIGLNYIEKAEYIFQKFGNKAGLLEVNNIFGDIYRRQNDFENAERYTLKVLTLAEEMDDGRFRRNAYKDLSKIYAKKRQFEKAYEYERQFNKLRNQLVNEEGNRNMAQAQALFGDQLKEMETERAEARNALLQADLERQAVVRNSLMGGAAALLLLAMLLYNRYRIKTKANHALSEKNEIIQKERERSDELLLNILPEETATELKEKGTAKARRYESVTVLFSDFKGFTKIAEKLTPEELVAELHACFSGFDVIMDKYNVEKIKTIGDAYMAVGGLPEPNQTHPQDVINAALEMQQFMDNRKQTIETFDMRIGIHTGPVVAGVVGNRKFAYDIWGDAVNLAARMESSGEPGRVNISEDTLALVKDQFKWTSRGKIPAKNKGEVEMFFVNELS